MSIMHLDITAQNNTWIIPIERRITVLKGDSGVGKTAMVNYLLNRHNNPIIKVKCELEIVVLNATIWKTAITATENSLLIFDDIEFTEINRFVELYEQTKDKGNYYLIITREDLDCEMFNSREVSVLHMVEDGFKHFTNPVTM